MDYQLNSENIGKLKAAALDAPCEPGVYIMKDAAGEIIYVGKAKSLKNRIKSYFTGEKDAKTATLMRRIASLETIIVQSEYDALLLENTLIKQHSPKYNISLKDGKTYPVIRITHEDFPRIFRTRRVVQDKSLYFGPFPDGQAVTAMIDLIDKLFPLRKCKKIKKNGPCMYYHIGRCMAPCSGKIGKEDYALHVQKVVKLLAGETDSLIIDLTVKMHEAARALKFEDAAQIRNAIRAIENLAGEETSVEDLNPEDRDYIAWAAEGVLATFTVFSMRGGKMTGRDLFRTKSAADEQDSLELFITTYYDQSRPPPAKIFFQDLSPRRQDAKDAKEDEEENSNNNFAPLRLCERNFEEKFNRMPELITPTEKHHGAILAMARQNAAEDLRKRLKERGAGPALDELMHALNLDARPELIEGFDIAQLDGKHPVASLITFKNGIPDRKNYRHFKLRTVIGIVDDYAAMREVVSRRYSRQIREEKELPDLILVDGGLGQVNAAKGVLDELGAEISIVGLAKREEELWLPEAKEPVVLSRQSEALKILQHVRDECHRFATGFNQKLRSKDLLFSALESVEGIGPKRAAVIMKTYESLSNIAAADVSEMAERCGIGEDAARAVRAVAKLTVQERERR
ncbi:MAG: excinuclease ABC subunit UvrC [Treponema sp.]|nr:excinuclease ABC subunit UvrC [Treponema sp.]MCL2237190.1 excinuclease ABC subunit UvrC [Treponema sp.]